MSSDDISLDDIEKRLSYSVRKKTRDIRRLTPKLMKEEKVKAYSLVTCLVGTLYIIVNFLTFINYLVPVSMFGYTQYTRDLNIIDFLFLLATLGGGVYYYIINSNLQKTKKKHELIRQSLISDIGKPFCVCDGGVCACSDFFGGRSIKDLYVKEMEKEGINIIY